MSLSPRWALTGQKPTDEGFIYEQCEKFQPSHIFCIHAKWTAQTALRAGVYFFRESVLLSWENMHEAASSTIPDYSSAVIDYCNCFIAAALFLLPLPAQP